VSDVSDVCDTFVTPQARSNRNTMVAFADNPSQWRISELVGDLDRLRKAARAGQQVKPETLKP
jgi:hypothetical protein